MKPNEFSDKEIQIINNHLLHRLPINTNVFAKINNCEISVINELIDLRMHILSKRNWLPVEDNYIVFLIQGIFTFQEIENHLICRVKDDIESRKRYIKNHFVIPEYVKGTRPTIFFNDPLSDSHFNFFFQSYFGNKQ